MTYNFMVTEYLRKTVKVEAESAEEAYEKVERLLEEEKIVLTYADFSDRDIDTIDDFENKQGRYGTHHTNEADYKADLDFTGKTDDVGRAEAQARSIHELSFADDEEKMRDFHEMSKDDFLRFYGYLTEEEYDATVAELAMNKA